MDKQTELKKLYDEYKEKFADEMVVTGFGKSDAGIVLIGEAPGKNEVKYGRPFVGAAGNNLTELLSAGGIDRDDVFITNVVKYRLYRINEKTGNMVNRPVTKSDLEKNLDYLHKEMKILSPKLIVTLGNTALHAICGGDVPISEVHGSLIEGLGFNVFPLYHPASIIYNRSLKETYQKDVEKLNKCIRSL